MSQAKKVIPKKKKVVVPSTRRQNSDIVIAINNDGNSTNQLTSPLLTFPTSDSDSDGVSPVLLTTSQNPVREGAPSALPPPHAVGDSVSIQALEQEGLHAGARSSPQPRASARPASSTTTKRNKGVNKGATSAAGKKASSPSSDPKDYIKKENRSLYKEEIAELLGEKKEKPNAKLTFSRLMSQAKPERWLLVMATIALFLSATFNLAIPALVGTIIDSISSSTATDTDWIYSKLQDMGYGSSPRDILNVSVIILVVLITLAAFFSCLRGYWFTLAGERVVARIRTKLFNHLLSFEVGFFDITRTGELINRLSSDTTILKDAVTINVSMALRWSATIFVGIIYLFIISWKLTLVMLAVVPLVAVCAMVYGGRIRKLSKATQDALAAATETAEESISHIRTVRSFSKEIKQEQIYAGKITSTYVLGAKIALYYGYFIGFISLIASGAMILVLWYGAVLVLDGEMTPGVLTSYVLYTLTVGMSLAGLSGLFAQFMQAIGACERVFELLDRAPRILDHQGLDRQEKFEGKIVLNNVSFSYPARPDVVVLKDINLSLHPGSITALVGPSGQGKSTIVSLIERFYDVTGGAILIDGVDIRELSLAYLHRHIGLVSQEPVLFATTIKDNLVYGVGREVNDTEIIAACEMANAWSFIQSFPEGLETMVGERGVRLSGGQKQRIAIARAILLDPRVLIADEATSSLDAESEFHVQQALDRLMVNRTVLIIAHRLSTVKGADNVVVIGKGSVIEQGTHAELLRKNGEYAKLVARQLAGDGEVDEVVEEEKEERRREKRKVREADEAARVMGRTTN